MNAKPLILGCLLSWVFAPGASSAWAQALSSTSEELVPRPDDTIASFTARAQEILEKKQEEATKATAETKTAVETSTPKAIAQKPTTAASPPAFADRVNAAIADFLPWFQFAVNEVASSEDKTSVTAKFNPIPVGMYGNLSLNATATQPQVFKALEELIVEPAREAQRKSLLGKVDDFSDLTIALSYGFQWRAGSWDNTRKLFGRNYELYSNLASTLLDEALGEVARDIDDREDKINRQQRSLLEEMKGQGILRKALEKDGLIQENQPVPELVNIGPIKLATLETLSAALHKRFVDVLRQQAQLSSDVTATVQKAIKDHKLDALPAMIDNQPQIIFQGSYRESHDIIGRDAAAITASYEMGSRNINAMLREYHQMRREGIESPSKLEAFRRGVTDRAYKFEDKVIFSASFLRNRPYSFSFDYKESVSVPGATEPVEIDRTAALNFPRSDDWRASLSWTRLWPRRVEEPETMLGAGLPQLPAVTGRQAPRSTLTIEWVEADQRIKLNDKPLENDRLVARLSLVVPVPGGMTMPLTIVYSDKPEFLKDQDRVFGAHVGISYKIGEKSAAAGQ